MNNIERIEQIEKELAELKRQVKAEQEIKPVFPPNIRGYGVNYLVVNGDAAQVYGLTAGSFDGAKSIQTWLRARARIIERINIVNRGDNGFKNDKDNLLVECNTKIYPAWGFSFEVFQSTESQFYIRTEEAAKELLNNPDHIADMRIYMSIGGK